MAQMTITSFMTGIKNWVLGKIGAITDLIPSQATSSNKLADKAFVNSSIATATATFQGTYNVVSDLSLSYNATHAQIQTALATKMSALSITPDNNDYAFVQIPTADATPTQIAKIEKYKYNGTAWAFEYELNNSGFTASQWAAINSGATLELIGKLSALPTNAQLIALLDDKVSWTDNGAYDVTAHNSGATFASLSAILNSENLDTLIPLAKRKGGMSIKFVQSSDNKYVQYRYMLQYENTTAGNAAFVNEDNWQGVDDEPTVGSENLVKSGGVEGVINIVNNKVIKLQNAVQDIEDDTLYVADKEGNVVAQVDDKGLKAIDVIIPDEEEDVHLLAKIKELGNDDIKNTYNDSLFVTDKDGYVIFSVDKDGLRAKTINSTDVLKNTWDGKIIATYGDSITAVNNGDFDAPIIPNLYNWGNEVASFFNFQKHYGRGIGSTCFKYNTSGGPIAWVKTDTGEYVSRNDSYTYDNYEGHVTIPDDCTPIRGDGSSFLRLSSMFPASIRETIDVVLVMFHNDFKQDMDTDVEWVPNDSTDPEWAASSYYSALGGDYNISTVKGGIASTVMKLQALMPQAMIILMTPIGGVYGTMGENSGDFNNTETSKMKKLADVVMDIAQRMSTACINVYGTCGINTLNRTTYIADNIHPYTVAGRKKVGRAVISGLMGQIANL